MGWNHTHDIAYSFLCVAFMADGSIDDTELEAIRGNVKVLLPDMAPDTFDEAMRDAVAVFLELETDDNRKVKFDESLAALKTMFESADQRFNYIKNLAYIVRADEQIFITEVELVERAVAALDMDDEVTLEPKKFTLFVHRKS